MKPSIFTITNYKKEYLLTYLKTVEELSRIRPITIIPLDDYTSDLRTQFSSLHMMECLQDIQLDHRIKPKEEEVTIAILGNRRQSKSIYFVGTNCSSKYIPLTLSVAEKISKLRDVGILFFK